MLRPRALTWGNFVQERYAAPQKAMLLLGSSLMQKSHQRSVLHAHESKREPRVCSAVERNGRHFVEVTLRVCNVRTWCLGLVFEGQEPEDNFLLPIRYLQDKNLTQEPCCSSCRLQL